MPHNHPKQNPHQHSLRKNMTPHERLLWRHLRERFPEVTFRRQVTLGPYIADFVSHEHNLVIELDGSQHADNPYDRQRDAWMKDHGLTVLRFWNLEVQTMIDGVLEAIHHTMLKQQGSRPNSGTA
jgi:adenine-specific DNA-methyltransferase